MRSFLLAILCLLYPAFSIHAQKLQVTEMSALPSNLYARENPRTDTGGKFCALLIVDVAGINDLSFSGDIIGETTQTLGGYYVYLSTSTKSVTFVHPTLGQGSIDFDKAGIELEEKCVYKVVLQKTKMRKAVLQVSPSHAKVSIDGQSYTLSADGSLETELEIGKHVLNIECENYETLSSDIEIVDAESPYAQNFDLQSKLVQKTIKCNAPDPSLYVDGEEYDIVGKKAKVPIGTHTVRMTANGYAENSASFNILDDKSKLSLKLPRLSKHQKGLSNRFIPLSYLTLSYSTFLSADSYDSPNLDMDEFKENLSAYSELSLGFHQNRYFNFVSGFHYGIEAGFLFGEDTEEEDLEFRLTIPALLFFNVPMGTYNNYRLHLGVGPLVGAHVWMSSDSGETGFEDLSFYYGARAEATFMLNKFIFGAGVDVVNESDDILFVPSVKIGLKL